MRSHSTTRSFSEHLRQADVSMLALRVVTARVLVVLSGSFMSQTETGPTLTRSPSPGGHAVLLGASFANKIYHACSVRILNSDRMPGGFANHYTTALPPVHAD